MNAKNNRVLIVDDNHSIHEDYQKILVRPACSVDLTAAEAALFDQPAGEASPLFALSSAFQGEDAVELVRQACAVGEPFALAFVDMRMPPGMDGLETARRLWAIDSDLQVVICSAYSDHTWTEMAAQLGAPDRWVILKKPFDNIEVLQIAHALAEKWALRQQTRAQVLDLEQRVAARTADLQSALDRLRTETAERQRLDDERRTIERKLEETQRLEGLGVLAGGVAHDFNNILTGILVSASLAGMDAPRGSEIEVHLRRIEENSRRAAGLCEQLLAYAGKGQVKAGALDLNTLIRDTLELLQVSIPKDVEFAVELAPSLPSIKGDAARLRQVFMNLVLNAAEALESGPRKIRLTSGTSRLDQPAIAAIAHPCTAVAGDYVVIEVTDTGVGMTAETIRRIFEPFYTTKFTGRGLGLCAALGIVRHHGGALDVKSERGRGTTFRIYLPACELVPENRAATAAPEKKRGGGGTVLVVDDEVSVRFAAATALKRQGFVVVTAGDGEEAVALAEGSAQPFAGILLDVTMPRMDGTTALLELRKRQPRVPVVLMSGLDPGGVARQVATLGGVTVLAKPFTVDELTQCAMERFLGASATPGGAK
jgi:signal transduction histidine kinase